MLWSLLAFFHVPFFCCFDVAPVFFLSALSYLVFRVDVMLLFVFFTEREGREWNVPFETMIFGMFGCAGSDKRGGRGGEKRGG